MLSNIKILIWDFDGTLYRPIPQLWRKIREAEYRTIMDHTRWSHEKTMEEFAEAHKQIPSATATVAALCGITTAEAAVYGERYINRKKYLRKDKKLIKLFTKLHNKTHYMLVNGVQKSTLESLRVLGLSTDQFTEIITSEIVGENKPSQKGFRYILEKTKLPPASHLMIGDRDAVDLAPARALGMRTCLVWLDTSGDHADVTLPTVYDISDVLL